MSTFPNQFVWSQSGRNMNIMSADRLDFSPPSNRSATSHSRSPGNTFKATAHHKDTTGFWSLLIFNLIFKRIFEPRGDVCLGPFSYIVSKINIEQIQPSWTWILSLHSVHLLASVAENEKRRVYSVLVCFHSKKQTFKIRKRHIFKDLHKSSDSFKLFYSITSR